VPPLRLISTVAVTALLAAIAATSSPAMIVRAETALVVHRGQPVRIAVKTPSHGVCIAEVRYSDGAVQDSGVKVPRGGAVSWTMRVPTNATLGAARWTVRCGVTWQRSGNWRVTPITAGDSPSSAPHVMIDKEGYSQRPDKYGTGSTVSYGLLLKNTSAKEDAKNVYLLINFASASGELIATVTKSVALISANGTFAFGDSMQMRTQVPVTKLEVTVNVTAHEPSKLVPLPHFVNVRILPSDNDPGWVSEVDGEVVNDTSPQTLVMAKISIVLLDATGRIVGGGTGISFSPLPSGSRMVFLAQSGFTGVPLSQAVVPMISVEPTYQTG
jgi:hypothetical protein